MEIINPLAGTLAQSTAVSRQQQTDKSQQVRRAQALRKDVAAAADSFEHQVESSEELTPIHEEQKNNGGKRKKRDRRATAAAAEEEPHIDITG